MRMKLYNYLMTHRVAKIIFLILLTPFFATWYGLKGFAENFAECWTDTFNAL